MTMLAEKIEHDFVKEAMDYIKYRPEYTVAEFEGTVVMRTTEIHEGYVRRTPGPDKLWGVFFGGGYYCGLDTIWDAFRVLVMLDDLSKGKRLL